MSYCKHLIFEIFQRSESVPLRVYSVDVYLHYSTHPGSIPLLSSCWLLEILGIPILFECLLYFCSINALVLTSMSPENKATIVIRVKIEKKKNPYIWDNTWYDWTCKCSWIITSQVFIFRLESLDSGKYYILKMIIIQFITLFDP